MSSFKAPCVNGSLTIDDNGSDPIVDLDPIFLNGLQNGSVTGNVAVRNCSQLPTLVGLDGITSIGGSLTISNCANLSTFGNVGFKLQTVGAFFLLQNLPNLTNISALISVQSVGSAFAVQFGTGLQDLTPLNTLTSCPWIEFYQSAATNVTAPFSGLTSTGRIVFFQTDMVSFSGFENLVDIKPMSGGTTGNINISGNSNLSNLNMGSSLETVELVTITGNSNLSSCCFMIPVFNNTPANVSISGNATGCNSVAQIDAPPSLSSCPSDMTISTNPTDCLGVITLASPVTSDNCDFLSYELDILAGDGTMLNDFAILSGQSLTYNLPLNVNTLRYTAEDANGNSRMCTTKIRVEDDVKPLISNIPSDVTIDCTESFPSIPSPLITDNCDANPMMTASSSIVMGDCDIGVMAEVQEYTWTATDASGNTQTESWKVTVLSDFSFDLGPDITACEGSSFVLDPGNIGETYTWSTGASSQGLSISNSGTYGLTVTTVNGCCYSDEIVVNFDDPPSASATGATLDCSASSVQIMGSSTSSGVSYSWTGPGGFTSDMQNPEVASVGDYILTVSTGGGCTETATATVIADTDVPDASATGGTLTCSVSSVEIMGSSTTGGVTYSWTGPGGFTSSDQNPTVTTAGIYTLTVLASNGCSVTADAEVIGDSEVPEVVTEDGSLDCNTNSLTYSVEGMAAWEGPDGFASSASEVNVMVPGTYSVTVTAENGCTASSSFDLLQDISTPDIMAEGGLLTCLVVGDTLKGSSSTEGASFEWSGPDGFMANIANPIAVTVGTYTLTVTGPNGCTASAMAQIEAGDDAPVLTGTGGIIDCINTTSVLSVTASQENLTYMWTGPNGFTAEGVSVEVSQPGSYVVTGTNEDGCSGSTNIQVEDQMDIPDLVISAPNLNCEEGATAFSASSSVAVSTYSWMGPGGFTSSEAAPEVDLPGLYTLSIVAENGCEAKDSFDLESDVEGPDAMAVGGELTCTENTISLTATSATDSVSFSWTGPDNYTSDEQNPIISVVGEYILSVTAKNGCTSIDTAIVTGDPDLPSISATGGTLDCVNEQVMLVGSTSSEDATFMWVGPNGFFSSNASPQVDNPGIYTFTVTSTGSCTVFSSVEVFLDNQIPDLLLGEGRVDCNAGTASFNIITSALNGTYAWSGPDGFTSDLLSPSYSKAGTYSVTITDTNGCSSEGVIDVADDVNFEVDLQINGSDASVEIIGGTPPFTIVFNNSIEGSSVMGLNDGEHFVSVMDGLGCERIIDFMITSTSTVDLEEDSGLEISPNPVVDQIRIQWEGNGERITIFDLNGQIVRSENVRGSQASVQDLKDLPSGMYILLLDGEEIRTTSKFVKD